MGCLVIVRDFEMIAVEGDNFGSDPISETGFTSIAGVQAITTPKNITMKKEPIFFTISFYSSCHDSIVQLVSNLSNVCFS